MQCIVQVMKLDTYTSLEYVAGGGKPVAHVLVQLAWKGHSLLDDACYYCALSPILLLCLHPLQQAIVPVVVM